MRAAVVTRYGPPEAVTIAEVPDPVARRDEVLVRVEAAAVTSGDARMRAGRFPAGFSLPARLAIGIRGPGRRCLASRSLARWSLHLQPTTSSRTAPGSRP